MKLYYAVLPLHYTEIPQFFTELPLYYIKTPLYNTELPLLYVITIHIVLVHDSLLGNSNFAHSIKLSRAW